MTPDQNEKLERLVHRTLRELPARPAPRSLEQRVQAEIARRAALPWWRKSFIHWPLTARAVFVIASGALVKLVLMATVWATQGFSAAQMKTAFTGEIEVLQNVQRVGATALDIAQSLLGAVPPLWLYGGLAVVAALYVALFGIGAAAYRTLYASN